jgi:8-oxo-dGTP pyrophosphatase MutT (NUDIX family)
MSTERETSYGGVVVRGDEVIVIVPRGRHRVLGLPKGGPMDGETPQETAAREVREETGITARVERRLGQVAYSYLCVFEDGDTADHDHEVDDARWIPLREARRRLSYPGERRMIEQALSILAANG